MPEALGDNSRYLGLLMMCANSFPVSMSGEVLLVFFHSCSGGKVRSFTIIHVIVPSFDTNLRAKCGLLNARCLMAANESALVGISSGTICSMANPSSLPTVNSKSVSEVIFSAYERLSSSSLLSSRMSERLRCENTSLFLTSTAA